MSYPSQSYSPSLAAALQYAEGSLPRESPKIDGISWHEPDATESRYSRYTLSSTTSFHTKTNRSTAPQSEYLRPFSNFQHDTWLENDPYERQGSTSRATNGYSAKSAARSIAARSSGSWMEESTETSSAKPNAPPGTPVIPFFVPHPPIASRTEPDHTYSEHDAWSPSKENPWSAASGSDLYLRSLEEDSRRFRVKMTRRVYLLLTILLLSIGLAVALAVTLSRKGDSRPQTDSQLAEDESSVSFLRLSSSGISSDSNLGLSPLPLSLPSSTYDSESSSPSSRPPGQTSRHSAEGSPKDVTSRLVSSTTSSIRQPAPTTASRSREERPPQNSPSSASREPPTTTREQAVAAQPTASIEAEQRVQGLETFNYWRPRFGAGLLSWSEDLERRAQLKAEKCVTSVPSGMQIALGGIDLPDSLRGWLGQRNTIYSYDNPSAGAFPQFVWKATTSVGCGQVRCDLTGDWVRVCAFEPAGNIDGQYEENVSPEISP